MTRYKWVVKQVFIERLLSLVKLCVQLFGVWEKMFISWVSAIPSVFGVSVFYNG